MTDALSSSGTLNPYLAVQNAMTTSTTRRCMNLAGVDLVSIRLVVLCAECGSLSAAARLGNMSLSAASHRLTNLESFFKTRLFGRDHRGLHLTEAGAVFLNHAQVVLQILHRLNDDLLSMKSDEPAQPAVSVANMRIAEALKKSEYQLTPVCPA